VQASIRPTVATAKLPRILIDPTTTGRWRFQLTAGERQVLAVVAFGASVTEIARGLHLSEGTLRRAASIRLPVAGR